MSNPESFIDEVTDELRRDKLFTAFRRYGWIAILLVLLIVGGAAVNEWRKAQWQAKSEAFGDAVLNALDLTDIPARRAALAAVPATGGQTGVLGLLEASDPEQDRDATLAALDAVAADTTLTNAYRDLAVLRRVLVAGADMPASERKAALDPIAAPGRPYRPLALELIALVQAEMGEREAAIAGLTALTQDQEASAGQRQRVGQVLVALGGAPVTQ